MMAYDREDPRTTRERMGPAFWTCALITLLSSGIGARFSLAAVEAPGRADLNTLLLFSRSSTLPLVILVVTLLRSSSGVATMALTMILIQVFDHFVGYRQHTIFAVWGPLCVGTVNALAFLWLQRDRAQLAQLRRLDAENTG